VKRFFFEKKEAKNFYVQATPWVGAPLVPSRMIA
jgi:hypothetical protein